MRFYTLSIAVLVTLFVTSCMNSNSSENAVIALNNGQKWEVNTEMTPYILDAEKMLNESDSNDYATLAKRLKEQNDGLIKSCTMNGESHDELHKWLHPHIQLVEALSKAKNQQEAEKTIAQLKESFQTYNTYFQ
ncbi:hypothetical protein [Lewinella cohaerens]|uniref:hypothetical protein n=1 Tax=Lewinella cohaerens TaxID=70995 RepID=UPI000379FD94|nr:hypothetical protein [Lewinella cohaerens]